MVQTKCHVSSVYVIFLLCLSWILTRGFTFKYFLPPYFFLPSLLCASLFLFISQSVSVTLSCIFFFFLFFLSLSALLSLIHHLPVSPSLSFSYLLLHLPPFTLFQPLSRSLCILLHFSLSSLLFPFSLSFRPFLSELF